MPLAVTLRLDHETAAPIQRMSRALAEQAGDDDAVRLGYPPHISLAVIPDGAAHAEIEKIVSDLTVRWDALPIALAGFGIFPLPDPVIWVVPVTTELLLSRHAALYAALVQYSVDPHYRPGAWVPYVTISQGTRSVARAMEVALSLWNGPIRGWADKIDLVRFHPVDIIGSHALREIDNPAGATREAGTATALQKS